MENTGVIVAVAAPTRPLVSQAEKRGKFTGVNFKGWQQRVFFLSYHSWSAEIYK